MGKRAFIFPGQGSQYIGMGQDFFNNIKESKRVFEEADDTLNTGLSNLIFKGSDEDLKRTEITQPAILTTTIAMQKAVEAIGIDCDYTAGLSLGEYSSLVMSKAMKFADALLLVKKRGMFMQEAVPVGIGGMAAILGLDMIHIPEMIRYSKGIGIVEVANYNSPDQIVISGEIEGIRAACKKAMELGAKKTVELPVSAPFHTSMLTSAGNKLKEELKNIEFGDTVKTVITNVDGNAVKDKNELASKLVNQVSSSVLWQQSVEYMIRDGVDTFIEIGPGKSLSGFVKRIGKNIGEEVKTVNISDVDTLMEAVDKLKKGA